MGDDWLDDSRWKALPGHVRALLQGNYAGPTDAWDHCDDGEALMWIAAINCADNQEAGSLWTDVVGLIDKQQPRGLVGGSDSEQNAFNGVRNALAGAAVGDRKKYAETRQRLLTDIAGLMRGKVPKPAWRP